ncbi:MAG: SAM-dependent DNA methyltransferase [Acidobacteria bacterium]|nr:SAM-dependent DNA methyltransferase [Acidobacteriota bacterium]
MLELATVQQISLTDKASISPPATWRLGSPRAGLSLAASVELRGAPIRNAVRVLSEGFCSEKFKEAFDQAFSSRHLPTTFSASQHLLSVRAAWNLIAIWLIAQNSGDCSSDCDIKEAEAWFRGVAVSEGLLSGELAEDNLWEATRLLKCIQFDAEFQALLPYIFEVHGPGSRASVMKDPTTAFNRTAKREKGVFYTPADVAYYMAEQVCTLYEGNILSARVLDPACGTGVFLLAMLRIAAQQKGKDFSALKYVISCLYGFDISGQALDATAFLLLKECLTEACAQGMKPYEAWYLIRQNLIETDSLSVDSSQHANTFPLFANAFPSLKELFPDISEGFDILIGNPPYAALGNREDYRLLADRFVSLKGVKAGSRLNLFPLFIEMMWQFTRPGCNASALVTPLSIAFNSGAQFENCRRAMRWNGGQWQFAFFDREPHALFGEEVKTRNAILFRCETTKTPKRGEAAIIETGHLRKWTSRTRDSLFKNIDFTSLHSIDISTGIPKLRGNSQAEAFKILMSRFDRFSSLALRIGTCAPIKALTGMDEHKVFVGATAYNFLNVYRSTKLQTDETNLPISESPVHCLEFETATDASAAFAILSSRLVFWMWHVLGDGFHVNSWLFKAIPFHKASFSQSEFNLLAHLGDVLWNDFQNHRFVSVNGGRQTIGFRPLTCYKERNCIDEILAASANLDKQFTFDLRQFVQENAVVDSTDGRRNRIMQHFIENTIE